MVFEDKIKPINKEGDFKRFLHVLDSYADEVHFQSQMIDHILGIYWL
jgi:hypothetical protein